MSVINPNCLLRCQYDTSKHKICPSNWLLVRRKHVHLGGGGGVALFKPLDKLGDTASHFKMERLYSLDWVFLKTTLQISTSFNIL
jgi:hypothetical protein